MIFIRELLNEHREMRRLPYNFKPEDHALFAHELNRCWGPCQATALCKVTVLGSTWLQWHPLGLLDSYRPGRTTHRRRLGCLKDLRHLRQRPQRICEALWIHDDLSANYFHWLTDVLPKLLVWEESGDNCRAVLLPPSLLNRHYVSDSLRILGFEPLAQRSLRVEISRLIVIGLTAPTGNFRPGLLQRLRQKMMVQCSAGSANPAIYISRADAAQRFLENEEELLPVLEKTVDRTAVKVVHLEGRSLAEQMQLFQGCKLLVGLHGAGLTNMLWMPPDSHVIEIRRRGDRHNNCYFSMACALGHTYSYLQADDVIPGQSTHKARLRLDPAELERVLKKVLTD